MVIPIDSPRPVIFGPHNLMSCGPPINGCAELRVCLAKPRVSGELSKSYSVELMALMGALRRRLAWVSGRRGGLGRSGRLGFVLGEGLGFVLSEGEVVLFLLKEVQPQQRVQPVEAGQ